MSAPLPTEESAEAQRPHKQSTFSRMSFLGGAHFLGSLCGFGAMWLLAVHFGDERLGRYLNALAWMTPAMIITRFGTDQYAVRQEAAGKDTPEGMAATVIRLRILMSLGGFALMLGLPYAFERLIEIQLLLAILSLCILPIILRVEWVGQALHRSNLYGSMQFGIQGLNLIFVVLIILLGTELWTVAAGRVLAEALVALFLLRWVAKNLAKPDFKSRGESIFHMARASAPIAGSRLLMGLCFGSDLLILGTVVDNASLGHYGLGLRLFLFMIALNWSYSVILFPRIAAHAHATDGAMSREVRRSLSIVIPFCLLAAGSLAALAHPILTIFFGEEFEPGVNSLRILCLALVFNMVNRHLSQVLLAKSKQSAELRIMIFGTLTHVVAKIALIPIFGIAGAALGSVSGELALMLAYALAARPLLKAKPAVP